MQKRFPILPILLIIMTSILGCTGQATAPIITPEGCVGFPTVNLANIETTTVMLNKLTGERCGKITEIAVSYPRTSFNLRATFAGVNEGAARFYTAEDPEANIFISVSEFSKFFNREFAINETYRIQGTGTLRVTWTYDPENAVYFLNFVSIVASPG